eukprot:3315665-Pyramimonas_sp.AAC.1
MALSAAGAWHRRIIGRTGGRSKVCTGAGGRALEWQRAKLDKAPHVPGLRDRSLGGVRARSEAAC